MADRALAMTDGARMDISLGDAVTTADRVAAAATGSAALSVFGLPLADVNQLVQLVGGVLTVAVLVLTGIYYLLKIHQMRADERESE